MVSFSTWSGRHSPIFSRGPDRNFSWVPPQSRGPDGGIKKTTLNEGRPLTDFKYLLNWSTTLSAYPKLHSCANFVHSSIFLLLTGATPGPWYILRKSQLLCTYSHRVNMALVFIGSNVLSILTVAPTKQQ